jgi:hypothetical protein
LLIIQLLIRQEEYSLHLPDTYSSTHRQRLGSSRTRKLGGKILKKRKYPQKNSFFFRGEQNTETDWETVVMPAKATKRAKGSVGEGEASSVNVSQVTKGRRLTNTPNCVRVQNEGLVFQFYHVSQSHFRFT